MNVFYDANGGKVIIGRELGRGGEGTVFEIEGKPEFAAKIYHEKISSDKADKLLRMKALQNDKLLRVTAWTTEVLRDTKDGQIVGFVMPKLKSGTAIHELYNPKSRRQYFPEADWRFLIHTATNLARAFSIVHSHAHAIGDVNHGNIVIAKDATVKLIDCDSYQLNAPQNETSEARGFLCEVGVSTHTPPELQGKSLREVTRTSNHDNFGLAVLIFQLLFMGRHPFSGSFLGEAENTLEDSIRENRFAFGDDAESRLMKQPPATLSLSSVKTEVAELFRRAFLTNENRPTAQEWIDALDIMLTEIKQCTVNSSHFYLKTTQKCSWCSLESESGVAFYPTNFSGNFDIVTIGNLIDTIKPPEIKSLQINSNQITASNVLSPSPEVRASLSDFHFSVAVFQTFWVFLTLAVSTFIPIQMSLILIVLSYFVCEELMKYLLGDLLEKAQLKLDNARQKRNSFYDNYKTNSLTKPFETLRGELKTTIKNYKSLPQEREFLVKSYGKKRYQRQLEIYLQNHLVSDSKLQGLTKKELENLEKKNIITAADIKKENFLWLANFNFALKIKLFDWRTHLEKTFVFEITDEILREEYQEIDKEIATKKLKLETELKNGLPRLQQNIKQISINQQLRVVESEKLFDNYRNAEFDLETVSKRRQLAVIFSILITSISFAIGITVRNFYIYESNEIVNSSNKMILPKMTPETSTYKSEKRVSQGYGDIKSAEPSYSKYSSDLARKKNTTFKELYDEGERNFLAGKMDDAIIYFEAAAIKSPSNVKAKVRLGESYYAQSSYEQAAKQFESVIMIEPKTKDTHLVLGYTYLQLDRKDDAINSFRNAIKYNPKLWTGYYQLGISLREAKQYSEAISYLKKGMELDVSSVDDFNKQLSLCYQEMSDEVATKSEPQRSQNYSSQK